MLKKIQGLFKPLTAETLAARELETAKRELLVAQSSEEYFRKMKEYHSARVGRLSAAVQPEKGARP